MNFRPCIDIHNGKVKQIVGSTLHENRVEASGSAALQENFISEKDAAWFAALYREKDLPGGHVILLNAADSPAYEATLQQAKRALGAWPGGLMAGGGITPENAQMFLDAGASHVIVTSYVFREGRIDRVRLEEMVRAVGKERLVLDLSCRRAATGENRSLQNQKENPAGGTYGERSAEEGAAYFVATDRWQHLTEEEVTPELLRDLSSFCDEFLIHAVDVEGKAEGIEEELLKKLAGSIREMSRCDSAGQDRTAADTRTDARKGTGAGIPITYAGGIRDLADIARIRELGEGQIDFTVGSALDLFGGTLSFEEMLRYLRQ